MICRALGQSMILMPGRAPKAAVSKLRTTARIPLALMLFNGAARWGRLQRPCRNDHFAFAFAGGASATAASLVSSRKVSVSCR